MSIDEIERLYARLEPGMEFSVHDESGRFRFHRFHDGDGSLTAWGPINRQQAQWRSFLPERVRTIHRKRTARPS